MIERERHGEGTESAVTVLRLAHGKVSALDRELVAALAQELATAEAAGSAVVLTGTGSVFSAGVDLFRLVEEAGEYRERFLAELCALFHQLVEFPRPLVAALNGHALAGGFVTACGCDYRIGVTGPATIGFTELKVGVPFPRIAQAMVLAVTPVHLREPMLYLAEPMPVAEAHRHGLLHELVSPGELAARALEVANRLAAVPPPAFAATKRQLREHQGLTDVADELDDLVAAWSSAGTLDAIRGFLAELRAKRR
ncbi:MAG TPA: enoyl-CoA hydratase/isomerase family protein [Thermoanaerobaculia bacterium]|nr:enoyl-CoA hydratase/isomerase family protein [Thermoanaerobaculia bacterium]